jgi:hypothetical protein
MVTPKISLPFALEHTIENGRWALSIQTRGEQGERVWGALEGCGLQGWKVLKGEAKMREVRRLEEGSRGVGAGPCAARPRRPH